MRMHNQPDIELINILGLCRGWNLSKNILVFSEEIKIKV